MKHEKEYKNSLQPLLKWLTGDANRHDEMAIDAQVKDDPFLADTIEGYRSMPEADHAADVTRLKARLRQKSERRRGAGFYLLRIAAVGAVLVAAWAVLQQFHISEKSAASMADMVQPEKVATATEPTAPLADSVGSAIVSQEKAAAKADDQVAVQQNAPQKTKSSESQPIPQTENRAFDYAQETEAAEAVPPPPVMDSKPSAPQKDEDLSSAKTSAEAKKRADAPSAGKPSASMPAPRKITGKVTDERGQPIIGAEISVNGSNKFIGFTDIDGNYSIDLPNGTALLYLYYNDYPLTRVEIGKRNQINISLAPGNDLISQIVFTASAVEAATGPLKSLRPVNGFLEYKKFLMANVHHPEAEKQRRPSYLVWVSFTLQADGTLTDFISKNKVPKAYVDETIRLLREGPKWEGTPGTTALFHFIID